MAHIGAVLITLAEKSTNYLDSLLLSGIIQLSGEFEFPAKTIFANNLITIGLIFKILSLTEIRI